MIANICNEIDALADGEPVFRIGEKAYSRDSKAPLKKKWL